MHLAFQLAEIDPGFRSFLFAVLALAAVVVVGIVILAQAKKRLQAKDEQPAVSGFTLSDLRQLHRDGQMSDEEFQRAKQRVIDAAKRAAERQAERSRTASSAATPSLTNPVEIPHRDVPISRPLSDVTDPDSADESKRSEAKSAPSDFDEDRGDESEEGPNRPMADP